MAKLIVKKASVKEKVWIRLSECSQNDLVKDEAGDIFLVTDEGIDDIDEQVKVVQLGGPASGNLFGLSHDHTVRKLRNPTLTYDD